MRRIARGLALSTALALASQACGGASAPNPETSASVVNILNTVPVTAIYPGSVEIVTPSGDQKANAILVGGLAISGHRYPRGFTDNDAPAISREPIRVSTRVVVSRGATHLNNDLACDTVNVSLEGLVNPASAHIGALAISSDKADMVSIAWPNQDGHPGETAQVCFSARNAPSGGVVLFMTDLPK